MLDEIRTKDAPLTAEKLMEGEMNVLTMWRTIEKKLRVLEDVVMPEIALYVKKH